MISVGFQLSLFPPHAGPEQDVLDRGDGFSWAPLGCDAEAT